MLLIIARGDRYEKCRRFLQLRLVCKKKTVWRTCSCFHRTSLISKVVEGVDNSSTLLEPQDRQLNPFAVPHESQPHKLEDVPASWKNTLNQNTDEETHGSGLPELLLSPTVIFSLVLLAVYLLISGLVGDFFNPIDAALASLKSGEPNAGAFLVFYLGQFQDPGPLFPWSVVTSMFLHATILHIASNTLFLIFFGFILEEHISKTRWVATFILTGIVGNLTFAAAGISGLIPSPTLGVGASGAVYGVMGTALGIRAAILVIFLAGLDLLAGGGFFAHFGGLITGFVLRFFWISRPDET